MHRSSVGRPVAAAASFVLPLFVLLVFSGASGAQEPTDRPYLIGQENRLEIVVSVIGEVNNPGEFRVTDDTDIMDLISKAGGPTEFADLGHVSVRRRELVGAAPTGQLVMDVDVTRFLLDASSPPLPVLAPGDVVTVRRNNRAKWRTFATFARDIAVVVSTYLLYLRVEQGN